MIADRPLSSFLIAAGALPFAFGALLLATGVDQLAPMGSTASFLLSYGFGIASFIMGIHWATSLYLGERSPLRLFLLSNLLFLCVWLTWLFSHPAVAALVQAVAFTVLLLIDRRLYAAELISRRYFLLRVVATLVAITALLVVCWRA